MTKNTVARRYAQALFNLIGSSDRGKVKEALHAMALAMKESNSLRHVLASPVFTFNEKEGVLSALSDKANAPAIMKDFLGQLLKKNRVTFLPEIAVAFQQLADAQEGKYQIRIRSAQPLEDAEQGRLRGELSRLMKQEVDIEFETEPSLISGLQVKVGSKVWDNTIKGRLSKMRALLSKG